MGGLCPDCEGEGRLPVGVASPAAWLVEAPPCETCLGARWDVDGYNESGRELDDPVDSYPTCPACGGSGKQRLAIQVPHFNAKRTANYAAGLVAVEGVWATQEWGPLPVVEAHRAGDHDRAVLLHRPSIGSRSTWHLRRKLRAGRFTHLEPITPPPGVDPASLVGCFARGGKIEGP
jgi:hypothetical protein